MKQPDTPLIYAALALVLALAGLDQTLLSTALPTIARDLGAGSQVSWLFSAYLIASTAVIPLYGKLADRHGPRPLLLAAGALFVGGSLACALSPSIELLIAARALQGLGGGGLMTLTLLSVNALYAPEQRARRQGLLGATYGLATMLGPLIGGVLVQQVSWHAAFALNVPLALAALAVLARARFGTPAPARGRFDSAGALLLPAALCALLLATRSGTLGSAAGHALLAVGAVLLLAWAAVERLAADPIVPFMLFNDRSLAASAALAICSGVAMFTAIVFLPMYLQQALLLTPTSSALHLLPLMVSLTAAASGSGRAMRAGATPRTLALAASLTSAASFGLLAWLLAHPAADPLAFSAAVVPLGFGLGLLFPLLTVVSQRSAPPRHLGIATATPIMLRALGGALGVALLGTMLARGIGAQMATMAAVAAMPAGGNGAALSDAARLAAAMAASLQPVMLAAGSVALVGALIALALPRAVSAATALRPPQPRAL